ncbi:MAG: TIM barrel protein, partial [Planctomycetia bacterium]|nr:TIM barrel protein [Planctomycetia bacterium]
MKVGVCTSPEQAEFAARAGAEFIESSVTGVIIPSIEMSGGKIVPETTQEAWQASAAILRDAPIDAEAFNGFIHSGLKSTGPERDLDRLAEYAGIAFARAASVGAKAIIYGSGKSRGAPEGFSVEQAREQMVEFLKILGSIATASGMVLALEHLNSLECNIATSVAEGTDLVRRAGVEGVAMLIDIYHLLKEAEPMENVRDAGTLIAHVHVSEPSRKYPGADGYDYKP